MTNFPAGHLVLREFELIADAHQTASRLALEASKANLDLRLIEVSATAGGAWICAWLPENRSTDAATLAATFKLEVVPVDEPLMNAFLSLAPKPNADSQRVLILESESIADVFKSARIYSEAGATLVELRVKRAGPVKGAYAYLVSEAETMSPPTATLAATSIELAGDYRRFFF